jgi:hypothetical protein
VVETAASFIQFGPLNSNAAVSVRGDIALNDFAYTCSGRLSQSGESSVHLTYSNGAGGPVVLASEPVPNLVAGVRHTLTGSARGDALACTWDGDAIAGTGTALDVGYAGLRVVRARVSFDYVAIYAIGP